MVLGERVSIKIDHRKGSIDENGLYYPINVGYIEDSYGRVAIRKVYLLGVFDPVDEYDGEFVAYIRSRGEEDRIVCQAFGASYSDDQIEEEISFAEKYVAIVRPVGL